MEGENNTGGNEFIMSCQYQDDVQSGLSTADDPQPGPSRDYVYRHNEDIPNRKYWICYNNFHIIKTRFNISASQSMSYAVHHENEETRNRKYWLYQNKIILFYNDTLVTEADSSASTLTQSTQEGYDSDSSSSSSSTSSSSSSRTDTTEERNDESKAV